MPEHTYKISAVSKNDPEKWSFTKDGQEINMLTYWIKVEGRDDPIRLFRSPKTAAPKQGDMLVGEIFDEERGLRLKVKAQPPGRGGQAAREDPRNMRAGMAVKTAYEQISREFSNRPVSERNRKDFEIAVARDAEFLFNIATKLAEQ